MGYLRIIIAGFFTFFISFHSQAQFDGISPYELGAGFGNVDAEDFKRTCKESAKSLLSFGGAAAEFAAECAQKVGSNVINGIGGGVKSLGSTGMAIGRCIWSPVDCASEVVENAKSFVNMMSQAVDKVQSMLANIEPRQAALMACEMIASAAARNLLRGGIPSIIAGLTTNLARFAALGPAALYLQKLGVAVDTIINIDRLMMDKVAALSGAAKAVFAREMKMCSI